MSARLALPGARCCQFGLVDCRSTPGARTARGDLWRSFVHRWSPVAQSRVAPAIGRSAKHWTLRCPVFRQVPGSATENSVGPRPASRVLLSNVSGDRRDVQAARPLLRRRKAVAIQRHQGRRRIVHAHDPTLRSWPPALPDRQASSSGKCGLTRLAGDANLRPLPHPAGRRSRCGAMS